MAGALAILAPLLPVLVTQVERLFGSKTGPTKLDTVTQMVAALAEKLATAGRLGGAAPSKDEISAEVNKVVAELNGKGLLDGLAKIVQPAEETDAKALARALMLWALR